MKTKFKINENELIINFDFSYDMYDNQNNVSSIRKYINKILINNNINFRGNKIIVFKDGILIGTFYLTNYYLNKLNYHKKNNYLSCTNSYFNNNNYIEISLNNITKNNNVLNLN